MSVPFELFFPPSSRFVGSQCVQVDPTHWVRNETFLTPIPPPPATCYPNACSASSARLTPRRYWTSALFCQITGA